MFGFRELAGCAMTANVSVRPKLMQKGYLFVVFKIV